MPDGPHMEGESALMSAPCAGRYALAALMAARFGAVASAWSGEARRMQSEHE